MTAPTELTVGQQIPALTLTVELQYMKVFSVIMADPNPIHFDPKHTAALGMGDKPINQGTLTLGYPINALLAMVGDPASIRRVQARFLGSVVQGDVVVAGGVVTEVNDGTATVDLWLDKHGPAGDVVRVLAGAATVATTPHV